MFAWFCRLSLHIAVDWTVDGEGRYGCHNFKYFRSAVLKLLLHPGLCTQKGNKFPKIGSSTKFYVKNSSDITKRRTIWDKHFQAVDREKIVMIISKKNFNDLFPSPPTSKNQLLILQPYNRRWLAVYLFILRYKGSRYFLSFVIVHYFLNKSEDILWTIFN